MGEELVTETDAISVVPKPHRDRVPLQSRDEAESNLLDRPLPPDAGMINYPTMAKAKVAVTLDSRLLERVDRLVKAERFPNRSQAIESALAEKLERLERGRLARECAKLDPNEERALADEGLAVDHGAWPEY
jgi:Arc/MetJ-type ribon-helix-helix transcriptional regulator